MVFPNKIGFSIKNIDIIGVIEDEEIFSKLFDDDAIHLYLLLALEVILMGRLLTLKVDDTLFSLVENIEAWNSFPWGEHLRCHLYNEIKNLKEMHGNEHYYGLFKDRNYVPTYTAPPIKEHRGLFETYLSKLEKARKHGKTGFMVSSIGGTTDNSVRKKWLNDLVIMELNFRLFKLETIIQAKLKFTDEFSSMISDLCDSLNSMFADLIESVDPAEDIGQDYLREEELRLCLDDEEKMRQIKCKFPWNDDYIVDRNFWLKLVCLDLARKCWLTEESNGLVERANRSLGEGIKARLGEGNKNWVVELHHVLWAHRTMIKLSHGDTPFSLTYRTEVVIPIEIEMPTYRTAVVDVVSNDEELRLNLDLLEERRQRTAICEAGARLKMTKYYNARVRGVTFRLGDFVYRSNDASHAVVGGKLGPKWKGPYEVTDALGDGSCKLWSMD
nr:reverse transcriptase domain-containing protein [Tanacetum cinerariifolium]